MKVGPSPGQQLSPVVRLQVPVLSLVGSRLSLSDLRYLSLAVRLPSLDLSQAVCVSATQPFQSLN